MSDEPPTCCDIARDEPDLGAHHVGYEVGGGGSAAAFVSDLAFFDDIPGFAPIYAYPQRPDADALCIGYDGGWSAVRILFHRPELGGRCLVYLCCGAVGGTLCHDFIGSLSRGRGALAPLGWHCSVFLRDHVDQF